MVTMKIDICLATYNGAPWIQEFLNSLECQSYKNWRLVVSDDASQDETLEMIGAHFKSNPEKLMVVKRTGTGKGVTGNFQDAVASTDSEYVLLADQDDVWLPEKLSASLELMSSTERNKETPTLVFSDLKVVDEHLACISESWWTYNHVKADFAKSFKGLLYQNIVPGCSMMLNRALIKMAMPFPKGIYMHDWWFLMVCSAFGDVDFSTKQLVLYRRHAGAQTAWEKGGVAQALYRQYKGREVMRKQFAKSVIQAEAFENMFEITTGQPQFGITNRQALRDYIDASKAGWWKKRWLLIRNGIHLTSNFRTARFYLLI